MNNYNYQYPNTYYYPNQNDERFAGGIIAPLLLGGVAGYAIGQNNNGRPMVFYPYPRPYYPYYPYYPTYRK